MENFSVFVYQDDVVFISNNSDQKAVKDYLLMIYFVLGITLCLQKVQ